MITLYRISDGGYKKDKLEFANKIYCLQNYLKVFGSEGLVLFADNCKPETIAQIEKLGIHAIPSQRGSSAQSWRMVAEYALENLKADEIVYFLEDDYLHRLNAAQIIKEGLEIADYVSLYDHPDKYKNADKGGNRFVATGGELSRVLLTSSTHWKTTTSTTMTFACKLSTLKEDYAIWEEFSRGSLPADDQIFYKLQGIRKFSYWLKGKRRRLITPIPGYSTHVEKAWLSPLVAWEKA